ncbi:MAG: YcaO-like family protein [Bacteroidales bacterium]|nr:YcaO-like family protein [Bacteroidales bacterium]
MAINKPYKDAEPLHTINRIRNILETLDIFTTETHYFSESNHFYSSRLRIENDNLGKLNIGTNGKGMTPELSLASAYGELMERIQNYGLFANTHYAFGKESENTSLKSNNVQFTYIPDEAYNALSELFDKVPDVFRGIFNTEDEVNLLQLLNKDLKDSNILSVPFYNVNKDKIEQLPISMISHFCSTNGMCAGNTYEEALVQGTCEILERHVIKQIYFHDITPPDIPLGYFKGSKIYDDIVKLEQDYPYKIIVKDCSLGEGWPVIGVLMINQETLKYKFKLGADTNPAIAVERCLTEIYQGAGNSPTNCDFSLSIDPFKTKKDRIDNYYKTIIDGSGYYPKSIFNTNVSYEFKRYYQSDALNSSEDLLSLSEFIIKKGFQIYIRDNSFLDFPAFYVYIPGMSELNYVFSNSEERINSMNLFNGVDNLLKIKSLETKKQEELIHCIERIELSEMHSEFNPSQFFLYNISEELEELLPSIFKVMLYYRFGDISKSYSSICEFIDTIHDSRREEYTYYFTVRTYLRMLLDEFDSEKILKQLPFYHGDEAFEVIEDFANPDNIFQYFPVPDCFDCASCEIKESCKYFDVMEIAGRIRQRNYTNTLDQMNLSKLFSKVYV